jgi:hypothetical protein
VAYAWNDPAAAAAVVDVVLPDADEPPLHAARRSPAPASRGRTVAILARRRLRFVGSDASVLVEAGFVSNVNGESGLGACEGIIRER